jgi:thioredoxin 1
MILNITDQNYGEYINSDIPVVLDFFADWCQPCKTLSPMIEQLSSEYEGKIIVGKVNSDDNNDLAVKYSIRNVPTLIFIKDGKVVDKQVGVTTKINIASKMDAML